jgi:DNA-binding CsgD family transcriptional regulator
VAFPTASEAILNACFTPDGMAAALQEIANTTNAEGATLTYSHRTTQLGAITSQSLLEHVAPYISADRPHDPRPQRVNPNLTEGFRLDQDDFSEGEIERNPFYQDFLRPRGFGWHACALLSGSPESQTVNLTLRRTTRQGAFEAEDLSVLSVQLPLIRATARITEMMGGLDGLSLDPMDEARRTLFGFDASGGAFVVRQGQETTSVLGVRGRRLVACDQEQQARVKATLDRALSLSKQASAILTDDDGDWWLFSVVPASTMAPSWMTPLVSWAVLAPYARSDEVSLARVQQIASFFGLSPAEARVAGLIGDARSVVDAARILRTSPGTVRNQLKSVFAKIGVSRQAELVAIFSRF